MDAEKPRWTCFHCGETFTDRASAALHFGATEDSVAACRIKAGAEGSLLKALRAAEAHAQEAWDALHAETTDAHRAMREAASRHGQALVAAEELGFQRGIAERDGSVAETTGLAIAERIRQEMTSGRQWWLGALTDVQRQEFETELTSTCVAVCEQELAPN